MIIDLAKREPVRSDEYRAFVRSLPCCGCGVTPAGHAHHCISDRHAARKASDTACMPLCPICHSALHSGWREWEAANNTQWFHVARTIERAAQLGVLVINVEMARAAA